MAVVALLAAKGGTGKSTLAVGLAVAHGQAGGSAAVIDLDPQRTASAWSRLRGAELPLVFGTGAPSLARMIDTALRRGVDLVLIDGPPREGSGAAEAARLADLVLIPSRPSAPDLITIPDTLALIGGTSAAIVFNAAQVQGQWAADATAAVRDFGTDICPVIVRQRVAHSRAFARGLSATASEPRSRAAAELQALYRWTMERLETKP